MGSWTDRITDALTDRKKATCTDEQTPHMHTAVQVQCSAETTDTDLRRLLKLNEVTPVMAAQVARTLTTTHTHTHTHARTHTHTCMLAKNIGLEQDA